MSNPPVTASPSQTLCKGDYTVAPIDREDGRLLVETLHYTGGASKTSVATHGLLDREGTLRGVAWWLPPTKNAAVSVCGDEWRDCASLSRLVVCPSVPTNGASFLIGGSIRILRSEGRWRHLLSYADEGEGHTGTIYKATNWKYLGVTKPSYRYRHPNGTLMSKKRGARTYSHREMIDMGYTPEGPFVKHKFYREA